MPAPVTTGVYVLPMLLAAGLVLGGLVAGIVLLIVGLAGQRKGLWLSGAIVGAVCLAALLGGMVVGLRIAKRRWEQRMTVQFQQAAAVMPSAPFELETLTGLELPPDAAVTSSLGFTEEGVHYYFRVESAEGVEDQLKARYQPATWKEVSKPMSPQFPDTQTGWDPERIRAASCYRGTHKDDMGSTHKVFAAYDAANQILYCVAIEPLEDISEPQGGPPIAPPGEDP